MLGALQSSQIFNLEIGASPWFTLVQRARSHVLVLTFPVSILHSPSSISFLRSAIRCLPRINLLDPSSRVHPEFRFQHPPKHHLRFSISRAARKNILRSIIYARQSSLPRLRIASVLENTHRTALSSHLKTSCISIPNNP